MKRRLPSGLALLALLLTGCSLVPRTADEGVVLVREGRAEAVILLPADAPAQVRADTELLRDLIQRMSGARLDMVAEAPVGRTRLRVLLEDDGTGGDDAHPARLAYGIHTAPGEVRLQAATAEGLRRAVYAFLENPLGCRKYDTGPAVVPQRPTIVVPPMQVTARPAFDYRLQNLHEPTYNAWHGVDTMDDYGLFVHTFHTLVPPDKYFATHPEYFSLLNGHRTPDGQLCLSNPEVLEVVIADLRRRMAAKPEAEFWSVSQNDTYVPCECDGCRALDEAAGGHSGSVLSFVNQVAAQFPDKTISTLAYQYTRSAPRGIRPLPNVNIMLCSIECDRSLPLTQHPGSASFVQDVKDWCALTDNIFLWDYVINFRNLYSPFPNLRVLQPNLQFFRDQGIRTVFEQGLPNRFGEFAELRQYLLAKLMVDPDADADAIIDDFLAGFYGPAAPHLRTYIDALHDALAASGEGLGIYSYPLASRDGFLSAANLRRYEGMLNAAEAAVAGDPVFSPRVQAAHLPVQFAMLEQAKVAADAAGGCFVRDEAGRLNARSEVLERLDLFVRRCRDLNVPALWEHGVSPDHYDTWTRHFLQDSEAAHLALGREVQLANPASDKYAGGRVETLTDGIRAWDDYRFHWLGFEGQDMVATIDLGSVQPITFLHVDFLQDINSWIFMPREVRYLVSRDGEHFDPVGHMACGTDEHLWGAVVQPFAVSLKEPVAARYIRVEADSFGTCPTWHKGSGGPAWIFADEIVIQ